MLHNLKLTFALVFASVVYLIFAHSVSANYTFTSNFELDLDGWGSITGHPLPSIETNLGRTYAYFTAPYGRRFPFISQTHNEDIYSVEFEFDYHSGGASQGSGVMVSNIVPTVNQSPPNDTGDYSVGLWNINGYFYILSPLCDNVGGCGMAINSRAIFKIPDDYWNSIKFTYSSDSLLVSLNDQSLSLPYGSIHKKPIGVLIGNPVYASNNQSWLSFAVDNLVIKYGYYSYPDPLPYYSQKNPEWKDVVYDSATDWAGAGLDTIERWGCAITSVAMVLDQYDINMPNGDVADPDKLNTWLKDQPDGYVGGGLLNWLAISRLARQARVAGQAETDLEFVKSTGSPVDELEAGLYPIINEGGHFVTLYDQDTDNYSLNDPKDESRTTKPKTDPIVSVNTYTPSDTDLSYILVVLNEQTEIEASFAGNNIGNLYTENLVDDVGGAMIPSTKLVYIPQPLDGNYRLNLNNPLPDPQTIKIYAYDTQGSVAILDQVVATGASSWELTYADNGTAPVLSLLDTLPPKYVGTNTFEGWYSAPQTAVFGFEDDNLSPDFVPPSCVIGNEGPKQTCTVTTTVCDTLDNCTELTLTSNPANIDLTPPPKTRKIWGVGLFPRSYLHWLPTWDTVKYRVEWGLTQNSLTNTATTKHPFVWVATPRTSRIFARVISIDRAGNESEPSATMVLPVWWGWWRF